MQISKIFFFKLVKQSCEMGQVLFDTNIKNAIFQLNICLFKSLLSKHSTEGGCAFYVFWG